MFKPQPRNIRNRLRASGKPFLLTGDYEEDCPGYWLHYEYLATHVGLTNVGSVGQLERWFAVIPEPGNPYDSNAVAVSLENHHIGYLPAKTAKGYAPFLVKYISRGWVPFVQGRIQARWFPPSEDYPSSKKWASVRVFIEDVEVEQPLRVWELPGARDFAAQGIGLIDHEKGSYWASAANHELEALKRFRSTFTGEYALARLVVLSQENQGRGTRVGIAWNGAVIGRLSAVSSGRYLEPLLQAEAEGMKVCVVVRISSKYEDGGCTVLLPRNLNLDDKGRIEVDHHFMQERPPILFSPSGELFQRRQVTVDFETLHNYFDDSGE